MRNLANGAIVIFVVVSGLSLWLHSRAPVAYAQTGAATPALRGKIISLKENDLVIAGPSGETKVTLRDKTVIRAEVPIKLSEIGPGMYVGATATQQADGRFLASAIHVFSEDQRGTSEGHRPLSSAPQSGATMTNANVEHVEDLTVRDIKGRVMTLKFPGGEVKVLVPPDIPIVKRVLADRAALKPGVEVSAQTTRGNDGGLFTAQITVRAPLR